MKKTSHSLQRIKDWMSFTSLKCVYIHKRTTNVAMNRDRHLANAGMAKKERQNTVGFEYSSFTVMVDPSFVL